jgi:CheY-like chemotaxis protein
MILVVDDDFAFLEEAREILNCERQVFLAADARQAWKLAQQLGFSVALVDLDLRGDDGLALIERLHSAFPELAIIAISSVMVQANVVTDATAHGAVAVLPKPITPEWKAVVERFRALRGRN